jgi:hypothetical protein
MKSKCYLAAGLLLLSQLTHSVARESIADVLADPKLDLSRPADRASSVARIKTIENQRAEHARAKAKALGLQMRTKKPNGGVIEIVDFEGDQPIYLETKNLNAAISTGVNLLQTSPYSLDGSGLIVGVWDAGSVRNTHQEFATGGRVSIMDGASLDDHATHVGGTIGAAGFSPSRKGMAFNAFIESFDWNNDLSEMTSRAATKPTQLASNIFISNHSYGYVEGWYGNQWIGNGTDQNAADHNFGQYSGHSASQDALLFNAPYYISFWAAGNDGNDNPTPGSTVSIGGQNVAYDPAKHPPGDGVYRNGFEMISAHGISKNVLTIGAANDAVTAGLRDATKATLASFSSTGPTDDGRIKPDLVGNGVGLSSPVSSSDTAYAQYSGTSMASPNAAGSATLVVDQYKRLFDSAMRSSTLKGLLIHTATDIGNPGPDYKYGWGLVDAKEAVDLVIDHHANPSKNRIREDIVTTGAASKTFKFLWDDVSPIRATICWTDPAGAATTAHDSRTSVLENDLNIKLIAPDGTEYFPFVMPFVGTWTVASMSENATTGVNNTDNVEQVLIPAPGQSGEWQVVVDYLGPLTNNEQRFSLVMSGVLDPNSLKSPVLDTVLINDGASYTTSANVTLNHTRSEGIALEYRASENADFSGATWQTYSNAPAFTLGGYGVRTVYLQLRNPIGSSAIISDSINFPDPNDPPVLVSFMVNNGENETSDPAVILTHAWSGGIPTQYRAGTDPGFTGAAWQAYTEEPGFILTDYGVQTVYFQLRNGKGSSLVLSATITHLRLATIAVSHDSSPIASGYKAPSAAYGSDFGFIFYGGPEVRRTFAVSNIGDTPLAIQHVIVPVGFLLEEGLSSVLAPGATDTFTVLMSNTLIGTNLGQVRISSSDVSHPIFQFTIKGTVSTQQQAVKSETPVAYPARIRTTEDKQVAVLIAGKDPQAKPLVFRILEKPKKGRLTGKAPNLVYIPDLNENGRDFFTFEVDNGLFKSAPARVDLVVTAVNDPPVAKNMKVKVPRDKRKVFRLKGSDIDSPLSSLRYKALGKPKSGALRWNKKGKVVYTPAKDFVGRAKFKYQISDGQDKSKAKTVTLIVK